MHAFSNGGAASLYHLRRAVCRPSPAVSPAPRYALVLDSTPGRFRYGAGYAAFTAGLAGLARWLFAPVVHALCAWYWLRHVLVGRGRTGPLAAVARALLDDGDDDDDDSDGAVETKGSRGRPGRRLEVRRTYVYGPGDLLVDWRDVEAHADEAAAKGFCVRRERFEGSAHVAHARADPERYWRVVRETWEGVISAAMG